MKTSSLLLFLAIFLYLFFSFLLVTKDPLVFPDESSFSNTAYFLSNRSIFAKPFEKQLSLIEQTTFTHYGPIYYLGLATFIKLFGYNILTTRSFSVLLGLLSLPLIYQTIRNISQSNLRASLATLLIATDLNFLRSSRFTRMEILVIFFSLLSLFFLTKAKKSPGKGLFLAILAFFTHFSNGLTPLLAILSTKFFKKENFKKKIRGLLFLSFPPATLFLLWFFLISSIFSPESLNESKNLIFGLITPNFHSLKIVLKTDYFTKIIYLTYLLGFFVLLKTKRKEKTITLFVFFLSSALLPLYGGSFFYLSFLPIATIIPLFLFLKEKTLLTVVSVIFLSINILTQLRLFKETQTFSYQDYSESISTCLPQNSKVFLLKLIPDPYPYLISKRKDLKIVYEKFHGNDDIYLVETSQKADYIVTSRDYEFNSNKDVSPVCSTLTAAVFKTSQVFP
jgi:4-amino-4-deoxy-L-arabinose transferase-like glycosyltransferase